MSYVFIQFVILRVTGGDFRWKVAVHKANETEEISVYKIFVEQISGCIESVNDLNVYKEC